MASSKDTESKKTMDVSMPGKSAPDTSARPVIVTHKPQVQDPMVTKTEEPVAEKPSDPKPVTSTHNKVIKPLSESPSQESDTEPAQKETSQEEEAAKDAAVVDAVAGQADLGKKNDNRDEEERKKQEAVAKLVEEKKYFVPVGQVAHRRNQRAFVVFLLLIVVLAGAYLALDAGLIELNVDLPFDLIKN